MLSIIQSQFIAMVSSLIAQPQTSVSMAALALSFDRLFAA